MTDISHIDTPFHQGELTIQRRVGKQAAIASYANKFIRSFMPDQHREFYRNLPFVVLGSIDDEGLPWASILPGKPGFIGSPNSTSLTLPNSALPGDPLNVSLSKTDAAIGMLGIELSTRRRNRVNMRVETIDNKNVHMRVDQSFGNCPQYIQTRDIEFIRDPKTMIDNPPATAFTQLDEKAQSLIDNADTFFVASFVQTDARPEIEGVDVSHRGGMPGFVKRENDVLTVPDYAGNNHFNTLGNFLINPKAGLIFPDFDSGDLLMLTGEVEILWEDHPEVIAFEGAQRAWRFKLKKGIWLKSALPFRTAFGAYSPSSELTDTWAKAKARKDALINKTQWQTVTVARIVEESRGIKSFYFKHAQNKPLPLFKPGQHITIKIPTGLSNSSLIRNYTLSSLPSDELYQISIKCEPQNGGSAFMHEHASVGDNFEIKFPRGSFYLDPTIKRPAVLLAAGIGITPMMSMVRHVLNENIKTQSTRALSVFHVNKTWRQTPFLKELKSLANKSQGQVRYFPSTSQFDESDRELGFPAPVGRMSVEMVKSQLAFDDYDFYLCGPTGFMQSLYDQLIAFGVRDKRIFAEAFGPASIKRTAVETSSQSAKQIEEADGALVIFKQSNRRSRWQSNDPTLLEVAEQQGITPEFGCRNGSCGSCSAKLHSGTIAYRKTPSASPEPGEVLICCAVPAKGTEQVVIDL